MTKILIITSKSDITSDFIVKRCKEQNLSFYRFNTEEFPKEIKITIDFSNNIFELVDTKLDSCFDLRSFSSVYYRRPEIAVLQNEDFTPGELNFIKNELFYTLEGVYKILRNSYWISPIFSIREAENKIYQLSVAESIGFDIPSSIISNSFVRIKEFYFQTNEKCIIKPIKSGLIEDKRNSKVIFTSKLDPILHQKASIESFPNYIQNHIVKKADVRVIVVGNIVFTSLIHSQDNDSTKVDWRKGEKSLRHTRIDLPSNLKEKCILLLKHLNLRFGAIDFILDNKERYIFLEINPNGQWAWIENQTGYRISYEIVNLLKNENF